MRCIMVVQQHHSSTYAGQTVRMGGELVLLGGCYRAFWTLFLQTSRFKQFLALNLTLMAGFPGTRCGRLK